jgi:hypothetical protein
VTELTSRVLIASEFNAKNGPHFAQAFEFCDVVASCDAVDLVAPGLNNYLHRRFRSLLPQYDGHNIQHDLNRLTGGVRKTLGLNSTPTVEPVVVGKDYELFFFVCWGPQSLVELTRIKHWRDRSRIAVAYLFEVWSSTLKADRGYLKLLDQFDHVFLLHTECIPHLTSYTRAACSWLPVGIDSLAATPYPSPPERVIDFYSMGNRSAPVHRELLNLAQSENLFYVYDTLLNRDSHVRSFVEHRALLANMIKRARYFIAFNPADLTDSKADKAAGEQVLPARLFEGAAGGAIMLGTAPKCPEFEECFHWPDAVVEISPNGSNVASVIHELNAHPKWTERLRRTSATWCLLKHDWVYRWEYLLTKIGMQPLPQLELRKSKLRSVVAAAMGELPI